MSFEFGPPVVVKPSHELLGEVLLAAGKSADASAEFQTSLAHNPGRSLSLLGLAKAQAASGDGAASKGTYARLAKQWRRGGPHGAGGGGGGGGGGGEDRAPSPRGGGGPRGAKCG